MAGGSFQRIVQRGCACAIILIAIAGSEVSAGEPSRLPSASGESSATLRKAALSRLPMSRLTRSAQNRILKIAQSPTIYRRLPTQAIDCDRDMFLFLTRNPDVLVGIWDLMGITNVQTRRTGPYQMEAQDGSGTTCSIDLVYGDPTTHIYLANGSYDGKLVAKPIRGSGVFVVTSHYAQSSDGRTTVTGTLDCFLQLDSIGADLIARTLSGLIGRSADNNFIETARFITQVSQASQRNPHGMLGVADRMPQVSDQTRDEFSEVIKGVASRAESRIASLPSKR